jgi:tape measure domain-containing protein
MPSVGNLTIGIKLALDNKEMTGNLAISRDQLRAFAADMKRAAETGTSAFGATRTALKSISSQLAEVRNALLGYFSIMQTMRGAQAIIDAADGMRQLSARVKIATADAADFARAQAGVFEIANRYGAAVDETARAFARLNPVIRQMGGGSAETLKMLDGLAASLKLSGATAAETSAVLLQFSQAMGSGRVGGDELRSMMENAEPLMRAVAQQMGKTTGELRQMAEQGLLTSEAFGNALLPAIDKLSNQAANVPLGISQSMQVLRNELGRAFGREFEQQATGLSEAVRALAGHADTAAKAVRVLSDGLVALGKVAAEVFAGAAVGGFFMAISRAAAAVGALRAALAGVNTVMLGLMAGAAVQKLERLSKMGRAGLLGLVFFGAYELTDWILEITRARAAITDLLTPIFELVDKLRGIDRAKEAQEAAAAAAAAATAAATTATEAGGQKRLSDPAAFARLTADLAYETRLREKHKQELIQLEQAYQDKLATLKDEAARKAFTNEYQEARRELLLKQKQEMDSILSKKQATITKLPELKKPMEDDIRAMQDALKTQGEIIESALAGRLIKQSDYWQAKEAIDAKAFATEREKLSRELAAQEDLIARLSSVKPKDANQKAEIAAKLNDAKVAAANLRAELDALDGREVAAKFKLEIDREKALQEIRDAVAEAQAEIARMTGTETPEMRRAAIERAMRDTIEKLKQDAEGAALVDRLIDLKVKEAELADFEKKWSLAIERMRTAEQSANAQAQAGLITTSQAQEMIANAHREAASAMEELLPKMEAIANALGPEAVAKVQQWKTVLLETKNVVDPVADAINTDVKNAFATMFEQIGTGAKSAKEAFLDFARSVILAINRIAAQKLAEQIFGSFGKGGGGIGGFISGLLNGFKFFATGGTVPGTGTGDTVPAMLTPGEYIIRRDVARRIGYRVLDAINGGGWVPSLSLGRLAFATGGAVPAVVQAATPAQSVRIVNVVDPALAADWLNSSAGERTILNILQRNAGAVKQVLA